MHHSLPLPTSRSPCSYVFLVDSQGRLRWRGSGSPSEKEMQTLLRCTDELLQQEQREQQAAQQEQQAAHQEQQAAQQAAEGAD